MLSLNNERVRVAMRDLLQGRLLIILTQRTTKAGAQIALLCLNVSVTTASAVTVVEHPVIRGIRGTSSEVDPSAFPQIDTLALTRCEELIRLFGGDHNTGQIADLGIFERDVVQILSHDPPYILDAAALSNSTA